MTDQSRENTGKFSWPGFIAGLLVGAGLFYLKWVFLEEIS